MDENELMVVGCPSCSQRFRVRQQSAGSAVQCPHCAQAVSVPALPKQSLPTPAAQPSPPAPKPFRLKPQPSLPAPEMAPVAPRPPAVADIKPGSGDPSSNLGLPSETAPDAAAPFAVQGARRHAKRNELRVPKTFGGAFFALFDFRFRYYITPWIIRIQWALFVTIMLLVMAVVTISYLPSSSSSSSVDVTTETTPLGNTATAPRWQFAPPEGMLQSLARAFSLIAILIFCLALMLSVRMILESAIVFFRIAEDLSIVKEMASQMVDESEL